MIYWYEPIFYMILGLITGLLFAGGLMFLPFILRAL